jgi:Bacterial membrane protein YfhO
VTRRHELIARLLLTLGALLPYWRLLTFSVIFVTDDYFASDIFNGELPARALAGQLLRSGHLPAWTTQMCSGFPLAGSPAEPIGLTLFALLPPAPALDALVVVLLLVAAHGAYSLARRFGAGIAGAVLAGLAFAGSGYIACQLKHVSIVSTVVWLPWGMWLIDRALSPRPSSGWPVAAFGLVFAEQVLSGFPQSAYIAALTYGVFALYRAIAVRAQSPGAAIYAPMSALAGAIVLGAAAGAVVMMPLSALGGISDRAEPLGYDWSTRLAYWMPNIQTFLVPYVHGDISDNTYEGPPFFWEDYGYVGVLTFLFALYGAYRDRRRPIVVFTFALTLLAYVIVLGRATPVFHAAYLLVPGMRLFRFPTRFLIVVELGLALLAAFGLTRLRDDLAHRWPVPSRIPSIAVAAICVLTALDLFVHQPRQNPMVPADAWLAPPASVELVRSTAAQPRTFTPRHRDVHRRVFLEARGWVNVEPYYRLRDVLAPNLGGGFWNVPTGDCYVGLSPRWYVDVWGDHNRELALMSVLSGNDFRASRLRVRPNFPTILGAYGVTHMITSFPVDGASLPFAGRAGSAYVYRVESAARVRFVAAARHMGDADAAKRLLDPAFDPSREVLVQDGPASLHPAIDAAAPAPQGGLPARTEIVREDAAVLDIEADAPADGFLLLADTFYPGWRAEVDGRSVPVYRANLSVRTIELPKGTHKIRFTYEAPGLARGLQISIAAMAGLLVWLAAGLYRLKRTGDRLVEPN